MSASHAWGTPRPACRRRGVVAAATVFTTMTVALNGAAVAAASAPASCGTAQISDVQGDGHHSNEDVVAGWFSESESGLKAVIQVNYAVWEPAHDDAEEASFAFLFSSGGVTRYVRAQAPRPPEAIRYDYGSWTRLGGFTSEGTTSGEASPAASRGWVAMDIPKAIVPSAGSVLGAPFILSSDGYSTPTEPHWVDRAPGGTSPDDGAERGADFTVGTCWGAPPPSHTTAVSLIAPSRSVGGGVVVVSGSVTPARAGVTVTLTVDTRTRRTRTLTTGPLGGFRTSIAIGEKTSLSATAEGIRSATRTVDVASVTTIRFVRLSSTTWRLDGTVRPSLPGQVMLLRTNAYLPTRTTTASRGRFTITLVRPVKGTYEAVFIPVGTTASRSTSNRGAIR